MLIKDFLRYLFVVAALVAFAGTAAAQGPVIDNNTTTSNLEMTATVQTAVQLNISTGAGGATVSGSTSTGRISARQHGHCLNCRTFSWIDDDHYPGCLGIQCGDPGRPDIAAQRGGRTLHRS